MMNLISFLLQMKKNQKGQGMVEYGLIIGLIAVVIIGALVAMSGGLDDLFSNIGTVLSGKADAATASPSATN